MKSSLIKTAVIMLFAATVGTGTALAGWYGNTYVNETASAVSLRVETYGSYEVYFSSGSVGDQDFQEEIDVTVAPGQSFDFEQQTMSDFKEYLLHCGYYWSDVFENSFYVSEF